MLSPMTDDIRTQRDVDPVRRQIGQNVKAELIRLGIGQERLAEILGVGQSQISRRIAGTIGFEAAELVQIATKLNIPVARFVDTPTPASAA